MGRRSRYLREVSPPPNSEEARLILDAVSALAGPYCEAGVETLHALCERRGLRELVRALDAWLTDPATYLNAARVALVAATARACTAPTRPARATVGVLASRPSGHL